MADVLKLTFLTSNNKKASFRVPYPNRNVTEDKVKQAMTQLIVDNVMRFENASLAGRLGAELQTVTEIPYNI